MSLLLDHGHPQANRYPVGMLRDEHRLVVERLNRQTVTDTVMMRKAMSSVLSKEGGKDFNEAIKDLNGD